MAVERDHEAALILAGIAATLNGASTHEELRHNIARLRTWQAAYGSAVGPVALRRVDEAIELLVVAAEAAAEKEEG